MTVQTTTSKRVRVRRWWLRCVPAAALAAIACWTVLTFAVDAGSKRTHTSAATSATGMDAVSPPGRRYVQGITALTFEGLAAMYGTPPVERPKHVPPEPLPRGTVSVGDVSAGLFVAAPAT